MEEARTRDETKDSTAQPMEERNLPEEAEKKDESVEATFEDLDRKQTDESMVVVGDGVKQDDFTQSNLVGSIEQSTDNGENNGTVIVGHPNGVNTENAESTESFEFANGSDETSSWESLSG